ncbi:MAG: SRPBCC domain-containing protein [Bacteroidota bacterium]
MKKTGFDSFTKKIYLKAAPQEIYALWATGQGICSWFLRKAQYRSEAGQLRNPKELIQSGDRYIWEWHNWDGQEEGTVLRANGSDFLEVTFSQSKVSLKITQEGEVCLLTLRQYDIPTDDQSKLNIHHGCSNGWAFWLTNLKAFLEHGILLNETRMDLTNIPDSGFEFVNI